MKLTDAYKLVKKANITLVMMPRVSVTMKLQEAFGFFASRNFLLFLAPLMMMLVGATPSLFAMPLDGFGRAVYWVFCLIGYAILAFAMLLSMAVASRFFHIGKFFTPLTCLPIAFGATKFAQYGATLFCNIVLSYNFVYMPYFLPQYFLILGVELIVMVWVLPAFLNRARENAPAADDAQEMGASGGVISANDKKFLLRDILYIQANQHYVTIRTEDREVLVRSTFKSILTQLPEDYGFQVHRSFWVSGNGVDLGRSLNEVDCVVLSCGTKIAVARSRQSAVRDWLTDLAAAA
ncbi:LytTR family transcriptional regulator [Rhodobacteraceae bacterium B1Z28]|uniref:LytTR family transcriptional regulator n=1 Tax=Ruegeria haliotis TaxID=2747601 RepID=A0ABX2PSJ5_9RHOB|nr:LytTR family DNA-binding domain-containing protein [Ruegeria haliotis]NVO57130.1 LytTR family transcriptional regulator [Ruegeria haliotis]